MITIHAINEFLSTKDLAIAGVSRDRKKFGFAVFTELKKRGYNLFPINPNTEMIDELKCYNSVLELPSGLNYLYIDTAKEKTAEIIRDAISKGIQNIWIQQKSDSPEALEISHENGIRLIYGECIIMHISPIEGFHKFHRFIRKLFGRMPR